MKKYIEQGQGQRIKAIRGHSSQKDFAQKLGISTLTLQRYEWGDRVPSGPVLEKLAEISGRTVDWILTGKEETSPGRSVAEGRVPYSDDVTQKILQMLEGMSEKEKREVLKYVEDKKLAEEHRREMKRRAG